MLCLVVRPRQGCLRGSILIALTFQFDLLYLLSKRDRGEREKYKAGGEPLGWTFEMGHFGSPLKRFDVAKRAP
jgi:hypothetical protein